MLKNLIILIDAYGLDLFESKNTPFLHNFITKLKFGPILGYTSAILPAIFSGTYPEENNYWVNYYFDPKDTPLKIYTRYLRYFPKFIDNQRLLRWISFRFLKFFKPTESLGYHSANIPFQALKFFNFHKKIFTDPHVLGDIKTIFDLLREKKRPFSYLGWPVFNESNIFREFQSQIKQTETIFLYLPRLDELIHKYGKNSDKIERYLRHLDKKLQGMINSIQKFDPKIIIHSDHGMSAIRQTFNLEHLVQQSNLKLGKDYLAFYDATIARFWIFNQTAENKLKHLLSNSTFGKILTESDIRRFKLNFSHNQYGDLIFLLNEGNYIHPNYFSILFGTPKAVHGYDPTLDSQSGIFLTNFKINLKEVSIKDTFDIFKTTLFQ
ncbi:MAG: alkaline phosphatase family protein [Candidatus Helarchaeota archaeon]